MHAILTESRCRSGGFTITELVVVIVIASILSVFAIARINTQSFDTEGFANRAAAMVRYAQKIAIAQRRTVFVVSTASNIKLCYTNSGCGTPVLDPASGSAFTYNPPSGITLSAASVSFDPLGRPSAGTTITVTGDVARNITIAAETGYVQYVP
jgi:MSHA pilin protein MshC